MYTNTALGVYAGTGTLYVGTGGFGLYGSSYFDGAIDEVRIYNRVLAEDEIVALSGATGTPVVVQFSETVKGTCPQTVTRVWTAVDGCGVQLRACERPDERSGVLEVQVGDDHVIDRVDVGERLDRHSSDTTGSTQHHDRTHLASVGFVEPLDEASHYVESFGVRGLMGADAGVPAPGRG